MTCLKMIGLVVLLSVCSFADSFGITHTGVGTGQIGAINFTNASFTITDLVDTANRQSFGSGYFIDDTSASIAIDGVGTFSFTTGTRTFVNNSNSTVGFSRAGVSGADLFNGPMDPAFATWDMLSAIGPISGTGFLLQWNNLPVNTDGGVLTFNNGTTDTTFTVSAVPEPSSIALFGAVVAGLLGVQLRRRQSRRDDLKQTA